MGRASIATRIRTLEAQLALANLLAPSSDEWFACWGDELAQLMSGEAPCAHALGEGGYG